MKLRTKYILLIATLHLVALALSWFIFNDNKLLFIAAEALIMVSVFLSWQLYRQLLQPLKTLLQGTDAIKDRDFSTRFLPTGKYEVDQLVDVYNAMMDQLREERTQQEQQHFFLEKLILTSPTGIIILDYDEKIRQVNPRALQFLLLEEKSLLGERVDTIAHPVLQEIAQLPAGGNKTIHPSGAETYKIQKSHFIDRGFARQFVMIEELTAEILAAEKKAYGKVIRMMAHEVNNTIGPVNSILSSTLYSKQNDSAITNALQVAIDRNNSLNIFTRNFADVVRLPEPNRKMIDMQQLIQQTIALIQMQAATKSIVFEWTRDHRPLMVSADPQQMELVLINIVKNAVEAIEEKGTITFTSNYVPRQIIIQDTGKGIAEDRSQLLFTPFFSTKPDGQGIGLTLIKEILIEHGFSFSLKTIAPGTTEFVINFE